MLCAQKRCRVASGQDTAISGYPVCVPQRWPPAFFERRGIRAPAAVFRQHEQGIKIQTRPAGGGGKICEKQGKSDFLAVHQCRQCFGFVLVEARVPSVSSSESAFPGGCSEAVRKMMNSGLGNVVSPCAAECHAAAHGIRIPSTGCFVGIIGQQTFVGAGKSLHSAAGCGIVIPASKNERMEASQMILRMMDGEENTSGPAIWSAAVFFAAAGKIDCAFRPVLPPWHIHGPFVACGCAALR